MIAGIDFSTKAIDIVLLDDDTDAATWHRFELTGQDAFERARDVARAMPGPTNAFWDSVVAIGIEDPRGYGAGSLYRVQGAILAKLPGRTLVHPLIPSSWRKTVGLPGNASKGHVAQFANGKRLIEASYPVTTGRLLYPGKFRDWPQDACDAYCIALATRSLIELGEAA